MIKPLQDYIMIEKLNANSEKAMGILLKYDGSNRTSIGRVLKVGPGKTITDIVETGQTVLYKLGKETNVEVDGKDVSFLDESDIIAIID